MILIDFTQTIIAGLMAQLKITDGDISEDMLRHMILNSVRNYQKRYSEEYGEIVGQLKVRLKELQAQYKDDMPLNAPSLCIYSFEEFKVEFSNFEMVVDNIASGLDPAASNYTVTSSYHNGNLVRP